MKRLICISLATLTGSVFAAEATPNLPSSAVVQRVLFANPGIQAASSQVQVEEANKVKLEAGSYEWSVRLGSQQRKSYPGLGAEQRFNEWNAALERPLRLPGKASLDAELGATGVALAETARGDVRHETSRSLLSMWFAWLHETVSARQWSEHVELLSQQTRAIQRRQQLGDAARLEAVQAEGALAQAQAQLVQVQVREQTAAEALRRRFPGLPMETQTRIAEPVTVTGTQNEWVDAIMEHSHELQLARGITQRAQLSASRSGRDRMPDPTVGIHVSSERGGEDRIVGAYISIPLPGSARRASSDAALAQADVAAREEMAVAQKIGSEAAILYESARAAFATWQAGRESAERLTQAASMSARAYQLGEGSLNELLTARRLANEASLSARLLQLDALGLRYRLLLDAHRLWDFDEEPTHVSQRD